MNRDNIDILVNAWRMYQDLAKNLSENCWKIKSVGIGFWAAIISYGYKKNDSNVFIFSLLIIFLFFIMESGMMRLQYKYIIKSTEIEKSINDFLMGASIDLPDGGISTNIETPSLTDLLNLLKLKRWLFWMPYLSQFIVTIGLIFIYN